MTRVSGAAIYLTATPRTTSSAFVHNLRHNKTVHKDVFFVSLEFKNGPYVPAEDRLSIEKLPKGFYCVLVSYGFLERADVSAVLRILRNRRFNLDPGDTTIFVSRESALLKDIRGKLRLRESLFILMLKNSESSIQYFNLPSDRVFEVGVRVRI